jgi:hypothetical protein
VPICSLLEGRAFDPEVVAMMGEVFEDVLKTLGLVDRKDPVTELIAHRVVELVRSGERDPVRLKQLTLGSIHGQGPKL